MSSLGSASLIRSLLWRIGRKLYCFARRESSNHPKTDGEYWLIEKLLVAKAPSNTCVLVDIGANVGDWTQHALSSLSCENQSGIIHAFEPTSSTFALLEARHGKASNVVLHHAALSSRSGTADLFVVGACAGTNSLIQIDGTPRESVKVQTFDEFMSEHDIDFVSLVKSDTEGHDFSVIQGASETFREGRVGVWQFEYNHRWLENGSCLKDVFAFISDMPYQLGKLYGNGIECYSEWHPELDRFFAGNYVLISNSYVEVVPCGQYRFDDCNTLVPNLPE